MPDFIWPNLPDSVEDENDYLGQSALVRQWVDAFEGWEFDLPQAKRLMVAGSQCFYSEYSGGVQLYTYIFLDGRWMSYAKGSPSELRRNARNFRRAASESELNAAHVEGY